ncbi:LysR substrate-binding domain-containing protein [Ideonella sp. DXS29W]|uniref:LysR substrate-binding domain-containing protein n=1 Tax=Ideonella lacteola TaxID=2984193 RepID=A0ABU9BV96_9BURK
MEFRQLEVFRAVMDCGSASAAAKLLGLSQPAVSRQISQMERELGLELFVRGAGKLKPTADAAALYDEATYAFAGLERVLNVARRMRGRDSGVLRMAAPFSFGEALLPRVVSMLAQEHPRLRYELELAGYDAITAMVAERRVDVAVLKQPLTNPAVAALPLVECGTVCVLPPSHPLARKASVTIDALSREPLVLLGRETTWRSDLHAQLRKAPRAAQVRIETHSATSACSFVAQGLGVSVLPALLAAQFIHRGVRLRPLQVPISHRFVVACATSLSQSPMVEHFARAARSVAHELLAEVAAP